MNKKLIRFIILIIIIMIMFSTIVSAKNNENNVDSETQKSIIRTEYIYNEQFNSVTAKIISDVELRDTKSTWTLNKTKKEYTKEFNQNMNYSTPVQDINGNIVNVEIEFDYIKPFEIKVEYNEININNNSLIVKIKSNTELKDNKSTWTLSDNKKEYTKKFTENIKYSTPVEDINGNIKMVEININQLKEIKLKVEKVYDNINNTVLASIKSNIKMKKTKSTWNLSEDQLIYTKTFSDNMNYNTPIVFENDSIKNVDIVITEIDKTGPEITLDYKYNSNDTVTIYMKSNEKLNDTKPSWKLSDDKKIYEKSFGENQDYYTMVQDIYGNETQVYIKFKKKLTNHWNDDGTNIFVGYILNDRNNIIVQVTANRMFKNTKPSWKLSEDQYTYTKIFDNDIDYSTPFTNINGTTINVPLYTDWFFKIITEKGTDGLSGAAVYGKNGGSSLEYLRFGNGPNVFFATFCVHGFEDNWWADGNVLASIANNFYNKLIESKDASIAKKWTIYIIPQVNPDGLKLGFTKDGPGRTTVYSSMGRGIDINRSWQTGSSYKKYTDNRNYNGTSGFQAFEAEYLRKFLLSHKSANGQTILVDLHGWEDQLIGDSGICAYYKQQYTTCSTRNYDSYGNQYLITWGRQNLGARTALVELPSARNWDEVNYMRLSDKYINATLNMLKGI